jgi:hypothetical protein
VTGSNRRPPACKGCAEVDRSDACGLLSGLPRAKRCNFPRHTASLLSNYSPSALRGRRRRCRRDRRAVGLSVVCRIEKSADEGPSPSTASESILGSPSDGLELSTSSLPCCLLRKPASGSPSRRTTLTSRTGCSVRGRSPSLQQRWSVRLHRNCSLERIGSDQRSACSNLRGHRLSVFTRVIPEGASSAASSSAVSMASSPEDRRLTASFLLLELTPPELCA